MNNLLTQKFPFAVIALLLALGMSCTHEPTIENNTPDNPYVHEWEDSTINGNATMSRMMFSVGEDSIKVIRNPDTRATTTPAGVVTFEENDIVTLAVSGSLRSSETKNYQIAANKTSLDYAGSTATDAYTWKSQSEAITLRAWSYGETLIDKDTPQADPVNSVFTLETNQKDNGYHELLYCTKSCNYGDDHEGIDLLMRHQLARVVITLTRKAADDASNVYSVTIGDGTAEIPTSATFLKEGSNKTWDDIGKEATTIITKSQTKDDVTYYSAVLIPGEYKNMTFVRVTTKEGESYNYYNYNLDATGITLEAGNQYNFTITLGNDVATLQTVYPTEWAASGYPVSSYSAGDQFGVYVRKPDGTMLYSNIPMTVSSAGSTVTLNASSYRTSLSTSYTYFIYYPYKSNPGTVTTNAANAASFFSGVISNWTTTTSQGTIAALHANDLQVGMISPTASDNRKSQTVSTTMAHKAGLARFTLTTNTGVPTSITYLNNVVSSSSGSNTVTASNSFSGFTPYNNSGTYHYIIRPSTNVTLNSASGTDQWLTSLTFNIAAGNTDLKSAKSRRWKFTSSATWNYDYQGREYTFEAPVTGNYTLQCWGAQGGYGTSRKNVSYTGGYGGYSVGTVSFNYGDQAYVSAGSQGVTNPDADYQDLVCFNGGGVAGGYSRVSPFSDYPGGGGATHIATVSGELKTLSSQVNKVLIVAGGGGQGYGYHGSDPNHPWSGNGGHGGGYIGNSGQYASTYYWLGSGGTQSSGGTTTPNPAYEYADHYQEYKIYYRGGFGEGGVKRGDSENDNGPASGGAGGGGYYGGAPSHYAGGAGGSGYIGNSLLSNKHMAGYGVAISNATATKTISVSNVSSTPTADYAKQGAGYARITITL